MVFHMVLIKTSQSSGQNVFVISNLSSLAYDLTTPLTPMPLPEESDEENILVKMEGNTKTIPLAWTMLEQGGVIGTSFTYGSNVWTLNGDAGSRTSIQQLEFWDEFAPNSIVDGYSFGIYEDGNDQGYIKDGSLTKFRASISGSSPIVWNINCDFIVGSAIAAFESNSPERPTIQTFTAPTSTSLRIDWKPYDGYASGEAPTLTNHTIRYKPTIGGTWTDVLTGTSLATEDDFTINNSGSTPVVTATEYIIKIASDNIESAGSLQRNFSFKRRVTTP